MSKFDIGLVIGSKLTAIYLNFLFKLENSYSWGIFLVFLGHGDPKIPSFLSDLVEKAPPYIKTRRLSPQR